MLDDERLEALLYPPLPDVPVDQRPVPDWAAVHRELRRPNMTLALLWEEYRAGAAGRVRLLLVLRSLSGVGWAAEADAAPGPHGGREAVRRLRRAHHGGVRWGDREVRRAEIFVAVLGASSFIYAEAIWSQALPDWIAVHVNVLTFLGGVPRQIVCDNLKAGITRACFYEPLVNRTYADMARALRHRDHPARPYKAA